MPVIELRNISNYILNSLNLKIMDKELLVLLGPTGSGKTTILNTIAGLAPYTGNVLFDNRPVDTIATVHRGLGYLFQSLALFPHLNVIANIAYSLKINHLLPDQIMTRAQELLSLMRIEHLEHRYPKDLSGGEKQRVALARALASSPHTLLLDEPMASLDARFSKYFRMEFRRLQKKLGFTTVYVTHDLTEAEEMGDRIAVLNHGKIQQVGSYDDIFFHPANKHVSEFIGEPNIFHCTYAKYLGDGLVEVGVGSMPIVIPHESGNVKKIAIHPGHINIYREKPPEPSINLRTGVIVDIEHTPFAEMLTITSNGVPIRVELHRELYEDMQLSVGTEVFLVFKLKWIRVFDNTNFQLDEESL
ncbi:MAG: ABC transporter ATP-binding protein [Deltaproteobacteria bacterium]|nr:ABC transporter ATP-binding protein [Deltaproteobacteria bacterium]